MRAQSTPLSSRPNWVGIDVSKAKLEADELESAQAQRFTSDRKGIEQQAQWQADQALSLSVKGIGKVILISLLVHLIELGKATNKQIAALAGLAPFNRDSGNYKGTRTTWARSVL